MRIFFSCSMLAFAMLFLAEGFVYAEDQLEPAAAVVNSERISMSELDREMRNVMSSNPELRDKKNIEALRKARQDTLEYLIIQELMVQEGKKLNLEPQDKDVEVEYAKIKQRFPSEDAFQQVMKQQGLTDKKLQRTIKRGLTIRKLLEVKIKPTAEPVTDKDIADFYEANKMGFLAPEKVHASHILIKVSGNASEQENADAEKQIKDMLQQAKGGADFAELAKKHSQCPSASRGGDLGYFTRGQMVKPFEDAVFALEVGQISDVVKTEFGYHIIKLQDKEPEKQMELKEVADQIKSILTEEKMNAATEKWLKPIRDKADVQIMVKG